MKRSLLCIPLLVVLGGTACETFNAPPEPVIVGLDQGILGDDSKKPLVIDFGEPVQESSVKVRVVPFVADGEGNLADKDNDDSTDIDATAFFVAIRRLRRTSAGRAGSARTARSSQSSRQARFRIGPRLAVLVEAGLSDKKGNKTKAQRILPFGYQVTLDCPDPVGGLPRGSLFLPRRRRGSPAGPSEAARADPEGQQIGLVHRTVLGRRARQERRKVQAGMRRHRGLPHAPRARMRSSLGEGDVGGRVPGLRGPTRRLREATAHGQRLRDRPSGRKRRFYQLPHRRGGRLASGHTAQSAPQRLLRKGGREVRRQRFVLRGQRHHRAGSRARAGLPACSRCAT